jgi:hypothetical protein
MSDKRTCLCSHDLLWHGVGIGHSACRFRAWVAGDVNGIACHCQGFRTVVPGETMPEPDLLQMFWRLDLVLSRIEATLRELVPAAATPEDDR